MSLRPAPPRNLAITGVPRGGTTLACKLIGACQNSVALSEPMDVMGLSDRSSAHAIGQILEFCERVRTQIAESATAPSKVRDGVVPDNPIGPHPSGSGRRPTVVTAGTLRIHGTLPPDHLLALKHNAAFTALLPALAAHMPTVAIVRNPFAVLASWESVDLPVHDGHAPAAERLDAELRARLEGEPDRRRRQLILLNWFFGKFRSMANLGPVVRYEDVVASGGQILLQAAGLSSGPTPALAARNNNPLYRRIDLRTIQELLAEDAERYWRDWYAETAVTALAAELLADGH